MGKAGDMRDGVKGITRVQGSLQPLDPKDPEKGNEVTIKFMLQGKYPDGTTWEREVTPEDEEYHYND